jgi:hypothetical protein
MSSWKGTGKPRVLAITFEESALRQVRLEMPLFNLKRHGLIEDYLITDHRFRYVPNNYLFDTVWLQREIHPKVFSLLDDLLENNYLYDMDDLLIGCPTFMRGRLDESGERRGLIRKALHKCKVLTCPTERLVGILERYTGAALSQKTIICPNGFEFPKALRKPERPAGLVWTSGDDPALMQSQTVIVNAVRKFSEKYDLPVYCFGYRTDPITNNIRNLVELGEVTFFHHKALLGSFPPQIGIAPLETMADQADLDFINAKSDVKMVDFGGFGHPSVYSNAQPYAGSDLRCGVLVPNDELSWFDAMEITYREKWKDLDKEQARVVEARNMDRIAGKLWYAAIRKAQLDYLLTGSDIKNKVNRCKAMRRSIAGSCKTGGLPHATVKALKTMLSFCGGKHDLRGRVTVVVIHRTGESCEIALESLRMQNCRNFETVIIEDSELRGPNWARNRGFEKVSTEYVLFSDNDIRWEPDALWTLTKTLDAHPEASYAYGAYDLVSKNEKSGQHRNLIETACNVPWSAERLRDFAKGNFVSSMSLVRTGDFPMADESLKRLTDYDTWLTMLEQGKTGVFCGKKIFSTDLRKGISFGDDVTYREAMERIIKKHNLE